MQLAKYPSGDVTGGLGMEPNAMSLGRPELRMLIANTASQALTGQNQVPGTRISRRNLARNLLKACKPYKKGTRWVFKPGYPPLLQETYSSMAASRRDINRDPCGRCIKSHFRCNVQFPFSSVLCEKCSKAGLESCPRRVPQPPTETTWHIVGADNYSAPQPTMTPGQTAPIKVNGPAGSLWDEQEMMTELMAYLDWLARNPPPNDQPTTDTTYIADEAMNYYPVNYHDTNTYLGHAPMEGGSGMANTPEAEVGWQGVAPWPDSPADPFDFNSPLTHGPYTYHGAFDDHELSDYQSS